MAPARLTPGSAIAWAVAAATGSPGATLVAAAATAAYGAGRLRAHGLPARQAIELSARRHAAGTAGLAAAATRVWWPLMLLTRRSRGLLAAAVAVPAAWEWLARRPPLDPVRYAALRAVDDASYGLGVWVGSVAERTAAPLAPQFGGLTHGRRPDRGRLHAPDPAGLP